jgi:hypothetical protein
MEFNSCGLDSGSTKVIGSDSNVMPARLQTLRYGKKGFEVAQRPISIYYNTLAHNVEPLGSKLSSSL